jgi:hypothetical protein
MTAGGAWHQAYGHLRKQAGRNGAMGLITAGT